MRKLNLLIALGISLVSACQNNSPTQTTTAQRPANSADVQTTANATAAAPGVKTGRGVGVVKAVNLKDVTVELDHEEIKGMMPAMQGMIFYAANKAELEALKPGDTVEFTLEENENHQERIVQIAKRK